MSWLAHLGLDITGLGLIYIALGAFTLNIIWEEW